MCFSAEASLAAFLIGATFSALSFSLGKPDDKIIGGFIGFVSLMQIVEYFLWSNPTCNSNNKIISLIGMILNNIQPVVLFLLIYAYSKRRLNLLYMLAAIIIYCFVAIPYSLQFQDRGQLQCTINSRSMDRFSHLEWNWTMMNYKLIMYGLFILMLIILPILGFQDIVLGYVFGSLALVSRVLSGLLYSSKSVGSLWCFYTVFFPMMYYSYRKLTSVPISSPLTLF